MALIVGAGGFVRVWALGEVGFNSDEAVYAGQAAALAGDPALAGLFPVFRAHPLLFQAMLSFGFPASVSDTGTRLLSVAFGLSTVVTVYLLGKLLYGRKVGLTAAFFLAVMPYHVVVTRQVLLDGPETFFAAVVLYCTARFCAERTPRWLYCAAAVMGLTLLTKESAAILVAALFVFFVLRREFRIRLRDLLVALVILAAVVVAYPLSLSLSGWTSTGQNYLVWQLFRRANHGISFYAETVPPAIGPALIVLAAGGLWLLRGQSTWREWLLVCWIVVPLVFFHLWPVKGYQYLLPITPVVTVLAARAGVHVAVPWLSARRPAVAQRVRAAAILAVGASLAVPAWLAVNPAPSTTFLAGSGGVPAGREAGRWIAANLPEGSRLITVGPSMANLVRFYGHRKAFALSVSPNPLSRNPSYEPVDNPDRALRDGDLQYVVWDAFSAARAPFFGERLMRYVHKYDGVAIHTETIEVAGADGRTTPKPVIIVYEVRP
ncbi:4-amino-4-deoxy-L-arabinose transferase-like glycosyltransferase [Kibdelosporangium banguiense]|uniref:4-amino-4-deoxy-L-arabinose transferase-like glycosyltransferase n=1 Tax=Kibdelosporangium banguiense TaxID=1365924 RepID=A0ABS4TGD7_9PSEU|nr:glycosyltransferase family 39 protein [Kibdelosporangium banguiense]MBP2323491.1 4-amino-4-deoxy-L-arabinose transferase-like glycosyltransferase [Kibdelosporangium banguiense]